METHGEMEFELERLKTLLEIERGANALLVGRCLGLKREYDAIRKELAARLDTENEIIRVIDQFGRSRTAEGSFELGIGVWVGMCTAAAIYDWAVAVKGMAERMKQCRNCGHEADDHCDEDGDCWGGWGFSQGNCECSGFVR